MPGIKKALSSRADVMPEVDGSGLRWMDLA